MDSGIYQAPIRSFMDDLTVTTTTTTHIKARWVLTALEDSVSWADMKVKAKMSHRGEKYSFRHCKRVPNLHTAELYHL